MIDWLDIHSKDDILKIDIKKQLVVNVTQKKRLPAVIPDLMVRLHAEGGMIEYLQKNGLDSVSQLFR